MRERWLDLRSTSVFVREWGAPSDRVVLFWPGGIATGLSFNEAAPVLAAAGHWIVAVDPPGAGESPALPAEEYEINTLVGVSAGILDALDARSVAYVGHSWGAAIAFSYALAFPDRTAALVLLDGAYVDGTEPAFGEPQGEALLEAVRAWRRDRRWPSWDAFLAEERADSPRWNEALADAMRSTMRERDGRIEPRVEEEALLAMVRPLQTVSFTAAFPQLGSSGIPTLLLTATEPEENEDEREEFRRRFARGVPHSVVRPVPGCRHDVLSDGGPEVGRLITDWLAATIP